MDTWDVLTAFHATSQFLFFYLHLFDRLLFGLGGATFRDRELHQVAERALAVLLGEWIKSNPAADKDALIALISADELNEFQSWAVQFGTLLAP